MVENAKEPVEISTRMRPGEWTPESLKLLVGSHQQKLHAMGAPEQEVVTSVETPEDGSALVHVSWPHFGVHNFADMGEKTVNEHVGEAENSRGHGEFIARGEPTDDSKGLGAVFGDAERSAIDEPAPVYAAEAGGSDDDGDYRIYTDKSGKTFVEDAGTATGHGLRTGNDQPTGNDRRPNTARPAGVEQ